MHESVHAGRVLQRLRERVQAAGGWLPFDQWMQIALYEPGLGYYSAGAHKLGEGGDFTTAPEISPLFGHCLARHCADVLAATGGGDVLELGAGTGRLAFDLLNGMLALGAPPSRYLILEVSADLRERQRGLLAQLPPDLARRVQWLDAPPDGWQGALIANEVLDALAVECFTWRGGSVFERGVRLDDAHGFAWEERPAASALCAEVERLYQGSGAVWADGYQSEVCLRTGPWISEVTRGLQRGVVLFIDYGLARRDYYHPQRSLGTLRCHYRQQAHDNPLVHPGLQDITAWVDFTRVAEAAEGAGLEVLGFATQAAALLGLGIESAIAAAVDDRTRFLRASEARRLLLPDEMGECFKVIALGRRFEPPLRLFQHQDLTKRL